MNSIVVSVLVRRACVAFGLCLASLSFAQTRSVNINPTGNQTVTLGDTLTYSSLATDNNGDMFVHAFHWQDPEGRWNWQNNGANGLTLSQPSEEWFGAQSSNSRSLVVTPTRTGTFQVKWSASDPNGWYESSTYALTVVPPAAIVTIDVEDDHAVIGSTNYAQVRFSRTGSTASALTVRYQFTGTAQTWTDYRLWNTETMPDTFTIPAGQASASMILRATGVNSTEPETAGFQLLDQADYDVGSPSHAAFNIYTTEVGPPQVDITLEDGLAVIGSTNYAQVRFHRTGSTANALTVQYQFTGTAETWTDYRLSDNNTMPDTFIIPAGQSSWPMTLRATGVNSVEPETAGFVLLDRAEYDLGASSSATFEIYSTEPVTTPQVSISVDDGTATIGTTDYATIRFHRTGGTGSSLAVKYLFSGSAETWTDYRLWNNETMPDTFTIPAGQASAPMTMRATGVNNTANPETAGFQLLDQAHYDLGNPSYGEFAIHSGTPVAGTPQFDPAPGPYSSGQLVEITTSTPASANPTIRYTIDGTTPTSSSQLYGGPIQINSTTTVKAVAFAAGYTPSAVATALYTINGLPTAAAPTMTPAGNNFPPNQTVNVTINSATTPRIIRYTTNGTTPTEQSLEYVSPIAITSNTTLKAIVFAPNHNPSPVTTEFYTFGSSTGGPFTPHWSKIDNVGFDMPKPGDRGLHVLAHNLLELKRITSVPLQSTPTPGDWDFVAEDLVTEDANQPTATLPAASNFTVTVKVNGAPTSIGNIQVIGFKRMPLYAPHDNLEMRLENSIYLRLPDNSVGEGENVEVSVVYGGETFTAVAHPHRYSPAIHVNQEGYASTYHVPTVGPNGAVNGSVTSNLKTAMVGYYMGSAGEMPLSERPFQIVDAVTRQVIQTGTLARRAEQGLNFSAYQEVYEANFSNFSLPPAQYLLVVPGLGASLPFRIHDGIAMNLMRTYALGLYHQRCGVELGAPYTRFEHPACHLAHAKIPSVQPVNIMAEWGRTWNFVWNKIAEANYYQQSLSGQSDYQPGRTPMGFPETQNLGIGPRLVTKTGSGDQTSLTPNLRYPYTDPSHAPITGGATKGDTSLGHHDAGDYSKYTVNVAQLIHQLVFTVENVPGGLADNLGLPESDDDIPDLLQEAHLEAEYLLKIQDPSGGFYFLLYPPEASGEYENNPPHLTTGGQTLWPINTSATAAAVAALAQCASSPKFQQHFSGRVPFYRAAAEAGWAFLQNVYSSRPSETANGDYQIVTFYGHNFIDHDDLAWAACEMYLLTGNTAAHQELTAHFARDVGRTWKWGWRRMTESWGNARRSYVFAPRSGRNASLDQNLLAAFTLEIKNAGEMALNWASGIRPNQWNVTEAASRNSYGSSMTLDQKSKGTVEYLFSTDNASDIVAAYLLDPKADYIDALVTNMNYELGCNPLNMSFVTGLGLRRQRELTHQYAWEDDRAVPPTGIPIGNVAFRFEYIDEYHIPRGNGQKLNGLNLLAFPGMRNDAGGYAQYDRWADTHNVRAEFITVNQARSVMVAALLASGISGATTTDWKPNPVTPLQISVPATVQEGQPVTLTLTANSTFDLAAARVVWDGQDQEPRVSVPGAAQPTFVYTPKTSGPQWIEVEATLPDGRRVVASETFNATAGPLTIWMEDNFPAGSWPDYNNDPQWSWVNASPSPFSGSASLKYTGAAAGTHSILMNDMTPRPVSAGDRLILRVYIPAGQSPQELLVSWRDEQSSWDHRAYWGDRILNHGIDHRIGDVPAAGQWVELEVPASVVGLEGKSVTGLSFSLVNGTASFDYAGRRAPAP